MFYEDNCFFIREVASLAGRIVITPVIGNLCAKFPVDQRKLPGATLSNVQLELLKLYSTNLSEEDLQELKLLLARFYAEKAIQLANQIWDEKGFSDADVDRLLNKDRPS